MHDSEGNKFCDKLSLSAFSRWKRVGWKARKQTLIWLNAVKGFSIKHLSRPFPEHENTGTQRRSLLWTSSSCSPNELPPSLPCRFYSCTPSHFSSQTKDTSDNHIRSHVTRAALRCIKFSCNFEKSFCMFSPFCHFTSCLTIVQKYCRNESFKWALTPFQLVCNSMNKRCPPPPPLLWIISMPHKASVLAIVPITRFSLCTFSFVSFDLLLAQICAAFILNNWIICCIFLPSNWNLAKATKEEDAAVDKDELEKINRLGLSRVVHNFCCSFIGHFPWGFDLVEWRSKTCFYSTSASLLSWNMVL